MTILIAHRVNCLDILASAIKDKAQGIESDVQLSKDKIPVLYHDPLLNGIKVEDLTYEEISKVNNPDDITGKTNIISLDKLLKNSPNNMQFFMELKGKSKGLSAEVLKVFKLNGLEDKLTILSFFPHHLKEASTFKEENIQDYIDVKTALNIGSNNHGGKYSFKSEFYVDKVSDIKKSLQKFGVSPDILSPNYALLTKKDDVNILSENGKKQVITWTVNSPITAKELSEFGVDGIITDNVKNLNI